MPYVSARVFVCVHVRVTVPLSVCVWGGGGGAACMRHDCV